MRKGGGSNSSVGFFLTSPLRPHHRGKKRRKKRKERGSIYPAYRPGGRGRKKKKKMKCEKNHPASFLPRSKKKKKKEMPCRSFVARGKEGEQTVDHSSSLYPLLQLGKGEGEGRQSITIISSNSPWAIRRGEKGKGGRPNSEGVFHHLSLDRHLGVSKKRGGGEGSRNISLLRDKKERRGIGVILNSLSPLPYRFLYGERGGEKIRSSFSFSGKGGGEGKGGRGRGRTFMHQIVGQEGKKGGLILSTWGKGG